MTHTSIDITVGDPYQNTSFLPLSHEQAVRELAKNTFTLNGITSLPRITVDKMVFSATYTLQINNVFSTNQDKETIFKHLAETLSSSTNWEENTPYPRGLIYGDTPTLRKKKKHRQNHVLVKHVSGKLVTRYIQEKDYQPYYYTGHFPSIFSVVSPATLAEPKKADVLPKQLHLPAEDEKSFDQDHYLFLYEYLDKDGTVVHYELKWIVNIFCNPQRAHHHPMLSTEWGNTPEGLIRSFYRNPEIKADKDNIISEDMSQDTFILGMKNTCTGVLRIAHESLVHAVNETRMKEFVRNGYLPWENSLSSGDIKLVETDWVFPCHDAPCLLSSLYKTLKLAIPKIWLRDYAIHPELAGENPGAVEHRGNSIVAYLRRGVELSIYAEGLNMIRAEVRQKGKTGFNAYRIDGCSMATYVNPPVFEALMERVFLAMRSAHQALSKVIENIPAFDFKDPQEDPSGFIAWMWQIEPREKHQETVQEIIKWSISGCDLHTSNLSKKAQNLLRRLAAKKHFIARSKTFYPLF